MHRAVQGVTVTFGAGGFKAAAVTMFRTGYGAAPVEAAELYVTFDRPFAFAARHRPSGLVLLAGWVAEPEEWPREVPET